MSFEYYTKWWIKAKESFEKLYEKDTIFLQKQKPIKDRKLASKLLGGLYIQYSLIVQEIDACLDQMAQPQKRISIRKLMDAATIRLLELNNELRNIEISEYYYLDGNLIEMKLLPYHLEILHPALFYPRPIDIEDMWKKIKNGEKIFIPPEPEIIEEPAEGEDQAGETVEGAEGAKKEGANVEVTEKKEEAEAEKGENVEEPEAEKKVKVKKEKPKPKQPQFELEVKELTPEEIKELERQKLVTEQTIIIQIAERARQERLYFMERHITLINKLKAVEPGAKKRPPPPGPEITGPAANKIQTTWRGFAVRQWVKRKEGERRLLIGMNEPSWKSKEAFETFEKNLNVRREYRDLRIREYVESIENERTRILRVVAPGLFEDIGDEIREWFHEFYVRAKCFDNIPDEDKGGTVLVVRCETFTPEKYLAEQERKRKEKEKNKGKEKEMKQKAKELKLKLKKQEQARKKKEAERKKKEAAMKAKKKGKMDEYEYEYVDTTSKPLYEKGEEELREIWDQRNDFDNPLEKHYMDMITDEKCYEVQLEVRQQVDELMRLELELLQDALEEDKWRAKGKKGKRKKKKKKKPKKKKNKGKKKKDPTANRTTEDLFQELVDMGIIRTYPTVRLAEYKGDFSYKNWDLRMKDFDPPPTLLDVRQAIIMNCIMPLGVEEMNRPKSVLIAGPRQCGKHLLANAIFTETQCVLFDLSPEVTLDKYTGAKGMKMLIHLIGKMSRLLSPSIIYFEAADKIFYKKVPKDEKYLDPKRIGKKLFKGIVKTITPQDRVLVLGLSKQPWAAQAGKLKKAFQKNILIPPTDYGSLYIYWRELLMPYHGFDRDFDITSLVTVTVNYPLPVIKSVVEKILTPRRIIQLKYNPLRADELYEVIVSEGLEPITEKELKKFAKWYGKTPLGKERIAFNKFATIKREAEARAKDKGKK